MSDFEIGDCVQLNSGGPVMTICAIYKEASLVNGAGDVACYWFAEQNEMQPCHYKFNPDCLHYVEMIENDD